jgi:EamA domain-containing membrane protein RarD
VVFLGERMSRAGVAAVAMAALGVGWLTVRGGSVPWVALVLAFSFAFYALLRKTARVKPVPGLAVATALLTPVAQLDLAATASSGGLYFHRAWRLDLLLARRLSLPAAGVSAARRCRCPPGLLSTCRRPAVPARGPGCGGHDATGCSHAALVA